MYPERENNNLYSTLNLLTIAEIVFFFILSFFYSDKTYTYILVLRTY